MAKPVTVEDPQRVSTVVSKKHHEFIKLMCRRMSLSENRDITVSEAIRMALEAVYPVPKQEHMDLFENRE